MGYFIGHANDTTFAKLLSQLRTATFDERSFNGPMYTCGPEITIVLYANNKRRFFQSSWPTPDAEPLIKTLYEICGTSNLRRTEKSFEIDDERASR
jgi:hypothetical protein